MIKSEPDGVALPGPYQVLGGHIFSNDSRPLSIANIATLMAIGATCVPSKLDRYERIAPLYDLLDLPFEYSRYVRYDLCCCRGSSRNGELQPSEYQQRCPGKALPDFRCAWRNRTTRRRVATQTATQNAV